MHVCVVSSCVSCRRGLDAYVQGQKISHCSVTGLYIYFLYCRSPEGSTDLLVDRNERLTKRTLVSHFHGQNTHRPLTVFDDHPSDHSLTYLLQILRKDLF